MSIQEPAMKCQARIADASGSHAVPDPILVIGIPKGRSGIIRTIESVPTGSVATTESAAGGGW
jgi:hypothetical protein